MGHLRLYETFQMGLLGTLLFLLPLQYSQHSGTLYYTFYRVLYWKKYWQAELAHFLMIFSSYLHCEYSTVVLNILLCREPFRIYTLMCTLTYSTEYSTVFSTMNMRQGEFFPSEKMPVPLATWVSVYVILHTRAYIIVHSRAYNTVQYTVQFKVQFTVYYTVQFTLQAIEQCTV